MHDQGALQDELLLSNNYESLNNGICLESTTAQLVYVPIRFSDVSNLSSSFFSRPHMLHNLRLDWHITRDRFVLREVRFNTGNNQY